MTATATRLYLRDGAPPNDGEDDVSLKKLAPGKWHADKAISRPGKTPTHKKATFFCKTKAEAVILEAEWLKTIGSSLTVGTYEEAHRKYESLKPAAVLHNNRAYRRLLLARFAKCPLDESLDGEWVRFVGDLRAQGTEQGGINHYAANMRATIRLYIGPDAKMPIKSWGIERIPPRDVALTEAQQEMLLQRTYARESARHLLPILEYNFLVPSRYGELEGARVEDLVLVGPSPYFKVSALAVGRNKGGRTMRKPIPPQMRSYFETLPSDTEWLFYRRDRDGVCRRLGCIKTALGKVLKECELKGVWQFRDGRHAAYTGMVKAGTPKAIAQSIAGWATDMERVYYHQDADQDLRRVRYRQDEDGQDSDSEAAEG